MNRSEKLLHTALWALFAMLALSACGWHLRGDIDLPGHISPVYVQGTSDLAPLNRRLERALEASGAAVTRSPAEAASTLRIIADDSGRRVLSVDGRGKALEYELYEGIEFSLTGRDGKELVPPQRVGIQRPLLEPEIETLGKHREEADVRRVMREDLVARLLDRLRAQLK
jgi:LPS-assembly lipoprotein